MPIKDNGKQLEHRLTKLEAIQQEYCNDVDCLKKDMKEILQNHLPHLKTEMESLKRMVKMVGGIITTAIVVNIIVNLVFKI